MAPAAAAEGVPVKLPSSRSMLSRKFQWLQRSPSLAEPAQRPSGGGAANEAEAEAAMRQSPGGLAAEAQPRSTEASSPNDPHSAAEHGRPGGFKSMLRFGRRPFHWGSLPKDSPKGGQPQGAAETSAVQLPDGGPSMPREAGEGSAPQPLEDVTSSQQAAPDAAAAAAPIDITGDNPPEDAAAQDSHLADQFPADTAGGAAKRAAEARAGAAGLDQQGLPATESFGRRLALEARMSVVISDDGLGAEGPEIEPVHVPELEQWQPVHAGTGADATAATVPPPKPTHVRRRSLQRVPPVSGGGSGSFHARKLSIDDIGVGRVSSFHEQPSSILLAEDAGPSQDRGSNSTSNRAPAPSGTNPGATEDESADANGSSFPAGSEIRAEAGDLSGRSAGGEPPSGNEASDVPVARQCSWAGSEGERRLVKAMSGGMEDRGVAWLECVAVADVDAPDGASTTLQRPGTLKTWKSMKGSRGRHRLFGSSSEKDEGSDDGDKVKNFRGLWLKKVKPLTPKESVKRLLMWPRAGSQVPQCSPETFSFSSWSPVDPASFDVRSPTYLNDRRKQAALGYAVYEPWGVDVFHTPKKVFHVASHVELPPSDTDGAAAGIPLPLCLVINLMVPLYSSLPLLQSELDGPGISIVLYLKPNPEFFRRCSPQMRLLVEEMQPLTAPGIPKASSSSAAAGTAGAAAAAGTEGVLDSLQYGMAGGPEGGGGGPGGVPGGVEAGWGGAEGPGAEWGEVEEFQWHRPKLLARMVNGDAANLGPAGKRLVESWNGQPLLTRSYHRLYRGAEGEYVEMDVDLHSVPSAVRKGLQPFKNHLSDCVVDIAIILQGENSEELPEPVLACVRLHHLDLSHFGSLASGL